MSPEVRELLHAADEAMADRTRANGLNSVNANSMNSVNALLYSINQLLRAQVRQNEEILDELRKPH